MWVRPFAVRTNHYTLKYLLDQSLSTIPIRSVHTLSSPAIHLFDDFRREAEHLPDLVAARGKITRGEATTDWTVVDGLVLHADRIFVPTASR